MFTNICYCLSKEHFIEKYKKNLFVKIFKGMAIC